MRSWTRLLLLLDETYVAVCCTSYTAYRTAKNGFLCSCHSLFMYLLFFFFFLSFLFHFTSFRCSVSPVFLFYFSAFLPTFLSFFLRFYMYSSFFLRHFYFFHLCICLSFHFSFFRTILFVVACIISLLTIIFPSVLFLCCPYAFFLTFSFFLSEASRRASAAASPNDRVQRLAKRKYLKRK